MRALAATAAAVVLMAGCASVGGQVASEPAPWTPVGTYEFSTTIQGMGVGGTMEIAGQGNRFTGTIRVDPAMGLPALPMQAVEVAGREVTITADAGGELVFMVLTFTDDNTFTGEWSMSGDGGDVTGVRIAG